MSLPLFTQIGYLHSVHPQTGGINLENDGDFKNNVKFVITIKPVMKVKEWLKFKKWILRD